MFHMNLYRTKIAWFSAKYGGNIQFRLGYGFTMLIFDCFRHYNIFTERPIKI